MSPLLVVNEVHLVFRVFHHFYQAISKFSLNPQLSSILSQVLGQSSFHENIC